jgi:siroheme synthase
MQRFIEDTMVDRAGKGLTVCRLKGGDPFVFGRGGEEARALTAAGLEFEIVPGVTSATAAPASAGIPVTHRDVAHSFLVMTGSRAREAGPEEWSGAAALLEAGGTVVILMGLAHLPAIVGRLGAAGCGHATPAAVVSRGTCVDEDVRLGTLGTIAERAAGAASPGVIVFGEVVREREMLLALRTSDTGRSS